MSSVRESRGQLLSIAATAFVCLLAATTAGREVRLAWDANPESYVAGYKVYWGTNSRSYPFVLDAGRATSTTVSNLAEGQTYYFALTAYNAARLESEFSEEIPSYRLKIGYNRLASGGLKLSWSSQPGFTYRVLSKTKLNLPWSPRSTYLTATNFLSSWIDSAITRGDARFYTVEMLTPPAAYQPFRIHGITAPGRNGATLSWATRPGVTYRVLFKDSLRQTSWNTRTNVTASTTFTTWTDAGPMPATRFYCIQALP